MRGGYIELRTKQIESLPIKIPNTTEEKELAKQITAKVKEIVKLKKKDDNADTKTFESEIDDLAFDLYGLTPEERKVIEKAIES